MPSRGFWPFASSPLDGMDADAQYRAIRWGRAPWREVTVDVPGLTRRQTLVTLGYLRTFVFDALEGERLVFARPFPWLALGERDNRLYMVPREDKKARLVVPRGALARPIVQVWYDSLKGDEGALYHHEHEPRYPRLAQVAGGVQLRGGDYHVAAEGIVG